VRRYELRLLPGLSYVCKMRWLGIVGTVVVSASVAGCSLFEMKPLAPDYDPRTIPRCDADAIYAVGDEVVAIAATGLAVLIAVQGHDAEDGTSKWVGVIGSGVVGLAFGLSGIGGFRWSERCDNAKAQWDQRQIEQDEHLRDFEKARAKRRERSDGDEPTLKSAPPPRGFFCSASLGSPKASLCARDKDDCQRAREVALGAVPDLSACQLVETAFCKGERCRPTTESCSEIVGEEPCEETR
jgi:hypothetical protein